MAIRLYEYLEALIKKREEVEPMKWVMRGGKKVRIPPKTKTVEYTVRDSKCKTRDCFVPFSGNGKNICRNYELGKCPEN